MGDGVPDKPPLTRSEIRLVGRAVRGKWRVPESAFEDIPTELTVLAQTSEQDRVRVAAAKVLNEMLKSNREEERMEAEAPTAEEAPRLIIPATDDRYRPGHPR